MSTPPNKIDELLAPKTLSAEDLAHVNRVTALNAGSAPSSGNGSILNVVKDLPKFALSGAQSLVSDSGALVEGAGAFLRDPTLEARGKSFREGQAAQIAARTETLSPESQRVAGAGITDIGLFGGNVPTGQFLLGKTAELLPATAAGGGIGFGIRALTGGAIKLGAASAVGESLVSAPSGAAQQARNIDNTSTEKLLQDSSQFKAAFEKNAHLSPEAQDAAARSELKGLAIPTGALASALSVAAGSALANRAFKGTAGGVFDEAASTAQGVISGTLGGARREAIQEVAQSTLESISADTVTAKFVDPAAAKIDNLIKNAGLAALEGAVLGGTVGGVIGGVQGKLNKDATAKIEQAREIVKVREAEAKKAAVGKTAETGVAAESAVTPQAIKTASRIVKQVLDIPNEKSKVDVDGLRATAATLAETSPEVFEQISNTLGFSKNLSVADKLEQFNIAVDKQSGQSPDTRNLSIEQRQAREAAALDADRVPQGLTEGVEANTVRAAREVKEAGPRLPKSLRTELETIAADPDPVARALAFDDVVNRIGESGKNLKGLEAAGILRDKARAEIVANEGVAPADVISGEVAEGSGEAVPAKLDPEAVEFDDVNLQTPAAVNGEIPSITGIPAITETENITGVTQVSLSQEIRSITPIEDVVAIAADVDVPVQGLDEAQTREVVAQAVAEKENPATKASDAATVQTEGAAESQAIVAEQAAVTEQRQAADVAVQTQAPAAQIIAVDKLGDVVITQESLSARPVSELVKIGKKLGVARNNQSKLDFVTALTSANAPASDVAPAAVGETPLPVAQFDTVEPNPVVDVPGLGRVTASIQNLSGMGMGELTRLANRIKVPRNRAKKPAFVKAIRQGLISSVAPVAAEPIQQTVTPPDTAPQIVSDIIAEVINKVPTPVVDNLDSTQIRPETEQEIKHRKKPVQVITTPFTGEAITEARIKSGGPVTSAAERARNRLGESHFGDDIEDMAAVNALNVDIEDMTLNQAKDALLKKLAEVTASGDNITPNNEILFAERKELTSDAVAKIADDLINNAAPDQYVELNNLYLKYPEVVRAQLEREARRADPDLDNVLVEISVELDKVNNIPLEFAEDVVEDYFSLTDQQADGVSIESMPDTSTRDIRASFADTTGGKGMSVAQVKTALSKLTGQGFVRLTVVESVEQLPDDAKAFVKSSGIDGSVRGLYVPSTANSTDKIFIVAKNISSAEEAVFVALHEAVHRGLSKTFGSNMRKVLGAIHSGNANVRARVAARLKADPRTPVHVHIEEVLADMAKDGSARELNLWNRLVEFFAKWLQSKGLLVPISDSIVEQIVAGAQVVGLEADSISMNQDRKSQTASAEFRRFFEGSQITNPDGSPQVMYHGTAADDLVEFRRHVGNAIFITPSTEFANNFAKSAQGVAPNVIPVYVSAKNPFDYDNPEHIVQLTGQLIRGLDSSPGSQPYQRAVGRIRADMDKIVSDKESNWLVLETPLAQNAIKELGHDGFFVKENHTKNLGVYQPGQLKSAIGNRGTFSRVNPDIRASVRPDDGPVHTMDRVDGVLNDVVKFAESTAPTIKGWLHRKNLYFSTGAHIAEFYGRILGATMGPQVKAAIDVIEAANGRASALVNKLNKDTSIIEKEMAALSDKNQTTLYTLMGESTRLGIFPNKPFEEQQWLTLNQTNADIARARNLHTNLARTYNTNPEVAKVYDRALAHNDRDFATAYASILKTLAFSFSAPANIVAGLDPNMKLSVDPTIQGKFEEGVQLAELWMRTQAGFQGAEALTSMQEFRANRGQGPYFHLGRFGSHFIRFKVANNPESQAAVSAALAETKQTEAAFVSENSERVFMRFEHEQQHLQNTTLLKGLQDAGHIETLTSGKLEENMQKLDTGSLTFVQNLLGRVDADAALSEDPEVISALEMTKETIRRTIVEMMPEVTGSKHLARRKNREGYDLDMRRSFVKRSAANAFMVAHNTTRPEIIGGFKSFRSEIKKLEGISTPENVKTVRLATDVLNHLKKRLENNMTPIHAPVTDALSALGYTMFLASNPPHILANMTQPIQTTLPILGGKYGFTKAAGAMFKALKVATNILKDTVRDGYGAAGWTGLLDAHISIDRADLTPGQKAAMNAFIDSGRLEFTQAHGIGRIAQGQDERLNTWSKAMGAASHFSEAINRIVSGLAAYDLEVARAQAAGQSVEAAQEAATQFGLLTIGKTQFLYDTENKAYAFSKDGVLGSVTPLATGFQQFNMQMLQLISDLTLQAFQGSPQEQGEAKRAMAGMLATTTMLAGLIGLPFMAVIGAVYDRLGDDDDPNDLRADMTAWLSNIFGADATNIMMHGAADKVLGGTLSTRVALSDIIPFSRFLADRRELKDKLDSGAMGLLGPSVGAGVNIALGAAKIADGDVFKGMVMMLPAGLQGPLKGFDLAQNGFTTGRGDKMPITASNWDTVIQTLNFSPTIKSELQRNVSSEFVRDRLLNKRKSQLTRDFVDALENGTVDDQQRVGKEIVDFFVQNPERGAFDIAASIKGKADKLSVARATETGIQTSAARAADVINRLQGSITTNLKEGLANGL